MSAHLDRELFAAIVGFEGDERRAVELLELGASPAARDENGSTALYQAAAGGKAWAIGALLRAGAPANELSGGEGEGTPLCAAACWGYRAAVRVLLAGGADPNVAESDGYTPLIWAAIGGWDECVADLLEAGADPNRADSAGRTALHLAAERGRLLITRRLLEHGARAGLPDEHARRPLDIAESWAGKDVEAELRRDLLNHAPAGSVAESRHTITVEVRFPGGGVFSREMECRHAEIAKLLREHRAIENRMGIE
jgi:ankyrin repeat protein